MCRWAKVSRSGYSDWRDRAPSATALWRRDLASVIQFLFEQSDSTYGYRRIHADLARRCNHCHPETVRVLMREMNLVTCQPKPFRPTTTIAGDSSTTADLVNRDFTAEAPAQKLVSDITYIQTWEGWMYLAVVSDCFTKQVVGYAMADHMRTELVLQAIDDGAQTEGFHSWNNHISQRPRLPIHLHGTESSSEAIWATAFPWAYRDLL
ncbi:IS3 family transposase [Nakamurella antarctica]|uniref:IS3 family transposase n=1 Tax=Nakamurella antarctica TaxID=1902245 RepID=A0A3G8ZWJ2_9ACTN|nr:IS3 family transposase [Nakamurella antarctica]AZI58824.1 IS3 family transposase [Nakamurella antarctica]